MSDELGPITFEKLQQEFLDGFGNQRRPVALR